MNGAWVAECGGAVPARKKVAGVCTGGVYLQREIEKPLFNERVGEDWWLFIAYFCQIIFRFLHYVIILPSWTRVKHKVCSGQSEYNTGIDAPIPINTKLGDFNNVFGRIIVAAEHPHLSIPETDAGKSRKQYHRLINRSLVFVSGERIPCRHPFNESKRAYVVLQRVEELLKCFWPGSPDKAREELLPLKDIRDRCIRQLEQMRPDHMRRLNPTPYKGLQH